MVIVLVFCTALTNYYKLSGLEQYKFIILQLCKSEISPSELVKVLAGFPAFSHPGSIIAWPSPNFDPPPSC